MNLLGRGVISESQAFLIYAMFHDRRVANSEVLSLDNEVYLFGGFLPISYSINLVLAFILIYIFIA